MMKIKQTTMNNCFQACLASILEVPITEVPDFHHDDDEIRKEKRVEFNTSNKFGITLLQFDAELLDHDLIKGVMVIAGIVEDDGTLHAVVAQNKKILWDPTGDIVERKINDITVIVLKDPSRKPNWHA